MIAPPSHWSRAVESDTLDGGDQWQVRAMPPAVDAVPGSGSTGGGLHHRVHLHAVPWLMCEAEEAAGGSGVSAIMAATNASAHRAHHDVVTIRGMGHHADAPASSSTAAAAAPPASAAGLPAAELAPCSTDRSMPMVESADGLHTASAALLDVLRGGAQLPAGETSATSGDAGIMRLLATVQAELHAWWQRRNRATDGMCVEGFCAVGVRILEGVSPTSAMADGSQPPPRPTHYIAYCVGAPAASDSAGASCPMAAILLAPSSARPALNTRQATALVQACADGAAT
jgi:hypothetical protein